MPVLPEGVLTSDSRELLSLEAITSLLSDFQTTGGALGGVLPRKLRVGFRTQYSLTVQLSSQLSISSKLNDYRLDADGKVISPHQLPLDFRQQIQDQQRKPTSSTSKSGDKSSPPP